MTITRPSHLIATLALLVALLPATKGLAAGDTAQVPVLMYHHLVTGTPNSEAELHVDCFRNQMQFLHDHGFTTLSLAELEAHHEAGSFPARSVVITFDDGYRSFLEHAHPVLEAFRFDAVLFPVVSLRPGLQRAIVWTDHLSFHEIRAMAQGAGLLEVGSHTYDLHHLTDDELPAVLRQVDESPCEHEARVREDLMLSQMLLGVQTDQAVTALAWPFGAFDAAAVEVAQDLGFSLLFTTISGYVTPCAPLTALPRFNVAAGTGPCFREVVEGTLR